MSDWPDMPKPDWESRCGTVRLYCGDCLEILPQLPDGCVDAVVTDIPYNCSQKSGGLRRLDYGEWDKGFNVEPHLQHWFRLSPAWCAWCGEYQLSYLLEAMRKEGMARPLVWVKTNPTVINGTHHWLPGIESCAAGKRRGSPFFLSCHPGWWLRKNGGRTEHPCEKPIDIMQDQARAYCDVGGVILDPFMGSGTTGVACARLGRRFIGIELEPKYFDIAKTRIDQELRQGKLFTG
jgi:site-specific DNA-methyltransferase (adenine-specific)